MFPRPTGAALAIALALSQAPALADEATDAAAAFDEGIGHYRRKAYSESADAFFRAYRLAPSADAAYNAGLAWELAGKSALAATAYQVALARDLEPGAAADARARITRLSPELGKIEVSAPQGARIFVTPFELEAQRAVFYLEPGRHEVGVTFGDGPRRKRKVLASAGKSSVLLIEETEAEPEPGRDDAPAPTPRETPVASSGIATAGWISLGVGAVAVGAAVVLGVQALGARDDFNASGHRDADARSRAESLRLATNVSWGVAAVTVGAGVGLLLFAPSETPKAAAGAWRPSGVALRGRF